MLTFVVTFLMLLVVGLAIFFAWQQVQSFRANRLKEQMLPEDRRYFRRQFYRRMVGCLFLAALAIMVSGLFLLRIDQELDRIVELGKARAEGEELPEKEQAFLLFAARYVLVIGVLAASLVFLATLEMMAIRRYGMRQRKRIRDDRDDMLKRQMPLIRRSRNGHHS